MAKYDETIKEQIAALIEEGHNVSNICKITGIGRRTFYEWKNRYPNFAEMLEEAEQRRLEELHELANQALKKKLGGYYQTVSRTVYTPSEDESETLTIKQHTVTRKYCEPDTSLLLEVLGYRANKGKKKRNLSNKSTNPVLVVKRNEDKVKQDVDEVPPFTLKAKQVVEHDLPEVQTDVEEKDFEKEVIKTEEKPPIIKQEDNPNSNPETDQSISRVVSRPISKPTENLPPGYTHRA